MDGTVIEEQEAFSTEQLRTFHISGRGLAHAVPEMLRPAAIEKIPHPERPETADLPSLYSAALVETRGKCRAAFLERVRKSCVRLAELLAIDDSRAPEASSGDVISAALGNEASVFFNSGALAEVFANPAKGLDRLPADRRARIESTVATLEEAQREGANEPAYYLFSSAESEGAGDGFDTALEFCDKQLAAFTVVLRALRVARLESENAYDPLVHDALLDRFDWQAAEAEELSALPPIVALESVERLARMSLTSFGRLLRSGRPVHILVASSGLYADDLSGFAPDFGYLAMAHREAFVLQSSLARPEHLRAGFIDMARTLRPAVAVICVPPARFDGEEAWLETSLLHLSHAFPLYRYDPDRGETWAERFDLLTEDEVEATLADAIAPAPDYQRHFRVIPRSGWDDSEQVELRAYLEQYKERAPLAVPYINVIGEDGEEDRAAVTREIVNLVRDRTRAWRIFEELAGKNNAYVERAAAKAREDASGAAAGNDDKAKLEGATQAIYRVVAMLRGENVAAPGSASAPQQAAPPKAAPAAAAPYQEPPPAEETSLESADPYIDSFLCTSCNDCFKINPRVFAYDGNKQAYIADARAGTYAELVKAAAGCPAKCIHPGTPRPDDATATPQVLAKAAKLR